jgi:Ricin-type beta-trefoil lectin domain-like
VLQAAPVAELEIERRAISWPPSHLDATPSFRLAHYFCSRDIACQPPSGLVLDVEQRGRDAGAKIIQFPSAGATNQHWELIRVSADTFKIRAAHSGLDLNYPNNVIVGFATSSCGAGRNFNVRYENVSLTQP